MPTLTFRKLKHRTRKLLRNKPLVAVSTITLFCIGIIFYALVMQPKRLTVDPVTYRPLLQLIAQAESKGNYNAYFGNVHNASIDFTSMSITEVLQWQARFVQRGNPSSAVGRYQIIDTTLRGLVHELSIDMQQKFDQSTQDRLAIALLERRGSEKYINHELTRHEFAANLAKEWAALPKIIGDTPEASYYASDGLNQALVPVDHVLKAIAPISAK